MATGAQESPVESVHPFSAASPERRPGGRMLGSSMCLRRGLPPPCPVHQAPCSSRTPNSPLFLFSSTSRQIPHAVRLAGIPMGCPPPPYTHTHAYAHTLTRSAVTTEPTHVSRCFGIPACIYMFSYILLKPLYLHPILPSKYPVLKPLSLPICSGDLIEPTPSQCTGLPPGASYQLRAVGVPVFTHPPNGSLFALHRMICPFCHVLSPVHCRAAEQGAPLAVAMPAPPPAGEAG